MLDGRMEVRLSASLKAVVYFDLFQFTLPRRERRRSGCFYAGQRNFNPRSREGSDVRVKVLPLSELHFNPRSCEGSDVCRPPSSFGTEKFQSTLP